MRFHLPLDDLLTTRAGVRVLRSWLQVPTKAFTGRELAARSGVHPNRAHEILRRLQDVGLAEHRTVGRAHLWQLRPRHWLLMVLRTLFESEARAYEAVANTIRARLGGTAEVRAAILFGSVARGDESPSSDIDLLVLVDSAKAKKRLAVHVDAMQRDVAATFGNPLAVVIYSATEYERKRRSPLVKNIHREGRAVLGELP